MLGIAHHLLLSELRHSPRMFLEALERLLAQAIDLDTGSITASTSSVILYVARAVARVDNFASFLVAVATDAHETMGDAAGHRGLEIAPENLAIVREKQASLRETLRTKMHKILESWYRKLAKETVRRTDDSTLDTNTKRMCNLHAHLMLMYRNVGRAS